VYRITLNGGLAGQRAVFPNEKHEFLAACTEDRKMGQQAAQKGGLQKRTGRPAEKGSPPARPFL